MHAGDGFPPQKPDTQHICAMTAGTVTPYRQKNRNQNRLPPLGNLSMESERDVGLDQFVEADEARLIEIAYHKRMNRWVAVFCMPIFLFYAVFHFFLANTLQYIIFSALAVNAVAALVAGYWLTDLKRLVALKRVTAAIAFALLAASLLTGVMSDDLYIFIPWVFTFPVGVMLFFGKRIGIIWALAFCIALSVIVFVIDFPPWDAWGIKMFKYNATMSLMTILFIALISEIIRVRVQNDLVASQNEYRLAEQRQRQTNKELQREIELRAQSEKALAQSEKRYRALFEESAISLWEEEWSQVKTYLDALPLEAADDLKSFFKNNQEQIEACIAMMHVTAINRATLDLYEADTTSRLLRNLSRILPENHTDYLIERMVALYRQGRFNTEVSAQTLNGRKLHLLIGSTVPVGYENSWEKVFTSVYDVTERVAVEEEKKRVDQQLQHASQIQAIATLAGGIAHQFNNALAVIYGNLELLEANIRSGLETSRNFNALKASSDRMSQLTDQLLAYAQGGKYQPKPFSANDLIMRVLESKKTQIDPSIKLTAELAPDVLAVNGDTTQIKMVIEAVLANATEAINHGGQVKIATYNILIDSSVDEGNPPAPPGKYAVICIEDTGSGMSPEIRRRIFDPFFTTKIHGRGLGMAAAFGIIKNHDGIIMVDSEPDKGTRVMIYLPGANGRQPRPVSDRSQNAA
jgi:signal transduction histidine kinase